MTTPRRNFAWLAFLVVAIVIAGITAYMNGYGG